MTKGTRQARSDELIKLYKENNIYNFYVKGFDGNWQAQNFDTGASPQLRRVSTAVVGGQSAGSVGKSRSQAVRPIAAAASSSGSRGEQITDMDVALELGDLRPSRLAWISKHRNMQCICCRCNQRARIQENFDEKRQ